MSLIYLASVAQPEVIRTAAALPTTLFIGALPAMGRDGPKLVAITLTPVNASMLDLRRIVRILAPAGAFA
jgi:hypothetical protein